MISKSVLLLLLGLSATAALRLGGGRRRQDLLLQEKVAETFEKWNDYKRAHGKTYSLNEEASKLSNFVKNLQQIESHNGEYNRGLKSFKLGLNSMSDLSEEETFHFKGFRYPNIVGYVSNATQFVAPFNVQVPDHVDWREKGLVTPVKNQGACGSCWAFSATGALEGQHARKTGKLVSLSEQNLVDCVYDDHGGCHGGFYDMAYKYVKENGGIDTEDSYPYRAVELKCQFDKTHIGAKDTGFVDLPEGDEDKLKIALATQGPISIAIDAGNDSFMQYQGGVYAEPFCGNVMDKLDHAVLLVGYGTDKKFGDYWLIKNSWGTGWGEDGYIRMKRGAHNMCGVATAASYPLV